MVQVIYETWPDIVWCVCFITGLIWCSLVSAENADSEIDVTLTVIKRLSKWLWLALPRWSSDTIRSSNIKLMIMRTAWIGLGTFVKWYGEWFTKLYIIPKLNFVSISFLMLLARNSGRTEPTLKKDFAIHLALLYFSREFWGQGKFR